MKKITLTLAILSVIIAGSVFAHSGAKGVVKQRMDAMADMGDKSKIVADMMKGKIEYTPAAIIDAADAFVMHGENMAEFFPDTKESRTGSKTEALPKIWDEWDDFSVMVTKFVERSKALQDFAANTEDKTELKKAFFKTTKSCSGCHKRFRVQKN